MFGSRLHWNDVSSTQYFQIHLYYYDGTTCSSEYYTYSGNPVYSSDCSADPVNTRFFPDWDGGTLFLSAVRNDRNDWDLCNSYIISTNIGYYIYIFIYIYIYGYFRLW